MTGKERKWRCGKCSRELALKKVVFTYLGHTFSHEVPACPGCGRVYISKELAEGRIAEVEKQLEDK